MSAFRHSSAEPIYIYIYIYNNLSCTEKKEELWNLKKKKKKKKLYIYNYLSCTEKKGELCFFAVVIRKK